MNHQSKINLLRSRIIQIRNSDLFNDQEKIKLIRINREELVATQFLLAAQRINQVKANQQLKNNQPYQFSNTLKN
ncbi:hypothetical protein ACFS5M_12525 [Lacinutrix iliipiscaria]|uniref:Uncharacterized protein n=1 Tax=Lacinutrix iliipiscaria TaxID=1230532 RepID=A0ABW5WPW8_9FLAO